MLTNPKNLARFRALTKNVRPTTTIGLWVCTICAIGLFIASFFWPPCGVIDESVIKAVGYCFAFAGLFEVREAILEGLGIKLVHGNTTIEVKDQDGNTADNGEDDS